MSRPPVQLSVSEPGFWDKAVSISSTFAQIAVPFIALFLGWRFTNSIESESVQKDLVEISVEILAEPIPEAKLITVGNREHAVTESEIERDRHLRDWAVDILEDASPVEIPPDMAKALREGSQILVAPVEIPAAPAAEETGVTPATPESASEASDVAPATEATGPSGSMTIGNLVGLERATAVAVLIDQGFKVNDFEVCSGSVDAGEVRQILDSSEKVVYVDLGGTTAAGRSVPYGSVLTVKIGSGQRC